MSELIPIDRIDNKIYLLRGQKVMIDRDLAELYGVKTFVLNQAVRRNKSRFPVDFMFQLTPNETKALRSQFVILENYRSLRGRHSKYRPYVFTEQGIAMLSGLLNSKRAIKINIMIIKTFVRLRQIISAYKELANINSELEKKYVKHEVEITTVSKVLKRLMMPKPEPERPAKTLKSL